VHEEAQWLQIAAHCKQASIQDLYSWYPFMAYVLVFKMEMESQKSNPTRSAFNFIDMITSEQHYATRYIKAV
jgi:hypothetical protein